MAGFLKKVKTKALKLNKKMEKYQGSITFAEAGQHDYAIKLSEKELENEQPGKLLVIGNESQFSDEVIDYSLDMAKRMSFEIIALNTAPLSCKSFSLFSASLKSVYNEFKEISEQNITSFKEQALKFQIQFTHTVKFSETDEAIEQIRKEYGNIDFVVSEPEEQQLDNRITNHKRLQNEIFVYSMV